nr:MAG TPA: hypothetical protein [Bacteriophage sp.]DAI57888.1 MAG TPA: hypothetical protein [Caudoviricetes sp.]
MITIFFSEDLVTNPYIVENSVSYLTFSPIL